MPSSAGSGWKFRAERVVLSAMLVTNAAVSPLWSASIFADGFESGDLLGWPPPPIECSADGRLCPQVCGNGVIEDLITGNPIALNPRDMVHVLLLPEGYTAADLATGVFDQDASEWVAEWQALEPYTTFGGAFCIWKWSVASEQHVSATSPQAADTAFLVPISSDGGSIDSSLPESGPTAQRVWNLIADFPFRPTSYYPAGGRTHNIAKNLVVAMMVYDPGTGASGFSGRSRRLINPENASERLSVAFAHNRAHEFTHAFARVQDEYIETCCGPLCTSNALAVNSAEIVNVVCSPVCGTLPWDHLRVGTPANPDTDQLVGTFGLGGVGYHPELRCLMNGTHDNATIYGGNGDLRAPRLCNFCRELTTFRLFERIHILDNPATSYETWVSTYRGAYYSRFGLTVPSPLPQQNSSGTPYFDACTDNLDLPRGPQLNLAVSPDEQACDGQLAFP